jgi:hypothetical protein
MFGNNNHEEEEEEPAKSKVSKRVKMPKFNKEVQKQTAFVVCEEEDISDSDEEKGENLKQKPKTVPNKQNSPLNMGRKRLVPEPKQ